MAPLIRLGGKAVALWALGAVLCYPAFVLVQALLAPGGPAHTLAKGEPGGLLYRAFVGPQLGSALLALLAWWAGAALVTLGFEWWIARRDGRPARFLRALSLVAGAYLGIAILTIGLLQIAAPPALLAAPAGVAAYVWWRLRDRVRRPDVITRGVTPRAGEIWWAEVPFEDVHESKDRPCLVVEFDRRNRTGTVMKITSQDKQDERGYVRLPAKGWSRDADKVSWLKTAPVIEVPQHDFRRYAGPCPRPTWNSVSGKARSAQ